MGPICWANLDVIGIERCVGIRIQRQYLLSGIGDVTLNRVVFESSEFSDTAILKSQRPCTSPRSNTPTAVIPSPSRLLSNMPTSCGINRHCMNMLASSKISSTRSRMATFLLSSSAWTYTASKSKTSVCCCGESFELDIDCRM